MAEYGDFQTPPSLARAVCALLARRSVAPASILEPTCGVGSFLLAAVEWFSTVRKAMGIEVNREYVETLRNKLAGKRRNADVVVVEGDFFGTDWPAVVHDLPDPLLIVGNPPWVTNAGLGVLGSGNLPAKSNFKNHTGLDAMTGKSNFDISEWMLLQMLKWLDGRDAILAMLCKTIVARKVLAHAWTHNIAIAGASMHSIDAAAAFGASVDACLLVCRFAPGGSVAEAQVYDGLADETPANVVGFRDGFLLADVPAYERWKRLRGSSPYRWRSGIKHDCAKVMELVREGGCFRNGLHELPELEENFVYPMLKCSDIARGRTAEPHRWMLVTQRRMGENTAGIEARAPRTWAYLAAHAGLLNRRASSIYRNRPPFSVFGVGDYSFAPWKVAISGLHKRLDFRVVGPHAGKPVVFDDTCCFIPCQSEDEAAYLAGLLNSPTAQEFFSSLIFWDAKRPITIDILRQLDLAALAREVGSEKEMARHLAHGSGLAVAAADSASPQLSLFQQL